MAPRKGLPYVNYINFLLKVESTTLLPMNEDGTTSPVDEPVPAKQMRPDIFQSSMNITRWPEDGTRAPDSYFLRVPPNVAADDVMQKALQMVVSQEEPDSGLFVDACAMASLAAKIHCRFVA